MFKHLLTGCMILGILSCSTPAKKLSAGNKFTVTSARDSLTSDLNRELGKGYFNGLAVALVDEQGTLYEEGLGYADKVSGKRYTENTIQPIASVSKTLIGIALLKAQELKQLKLDDPINRYLPFQVFHPDFPDVPITIRHLANHTSGIIDNVFYFTRNYFLLPDQSPEILPYTFDDTQIFNPYDSILSLGIFLEAMLTPDGKYYRQEGFTDSRPGEQYEYSNTGAALAAYIIESATGMKFDEFTDRYILRPLGMKNSGWSFRTVDFSKHTRLYENASTPVPFYTTITYPDGGFITSVHDMAQYLTELIKGYNGKGTILSGKSYKEFFKPYLTEQHFKERNTTNPYNDSYNTGIFIGLSHTGNIGHTGGDPGVTSMMFFNPATKTGRIIIMNTNISKQAEVNSFYNIWERLSKSKTR